MNTLVPIADEAERIRPAILDGAQPSNQAQGFETEILHFIDQHMPISRKIPVFYRQAGLVDGPLKGQQMALV
jgi:hypothetical protein